jgi:hypothetical protein
MAGATKLGRPAKATEPLPRSQLKAALKESRQAHAAVNKQKQAKARLFSDQVEAESKIEALQKGVKKAEQAHIQAVADAAVAGTPAPASTVAEAQASLAFAQDKIHTLRGARQTIEAELPSIFKRVGRGIAAAISEKLSVELWARALARRAYGPSPQPSSSSALSRRLCAGRLERRGRDRLRQCSRASVQATHGAPRPSALSTMSRSRLKTGSI